ncbi:MAG: hypothetical protein ACRED5_16670 [Propylenella sp.]
MRLVGLLLVALPMLLGSPAAAQEQPPAGDTSRIERLRALDDRGAEGGLEPSVVSPELLDETGQAVQRQALTAYYQYRIDGYEHRQRVFRWQLLSSRIIFVMVIFLVLVGVYFSWLQFRSALRGGPTPSAPSETTFEASASGFKVSSPVLGVIILAISLAFFYLYLAHVYPISEIL